MVFSRKKAEPILQEVAKKLEQMTYVTAHKVRPFVEQIHNDRIKRQGDLINAQQAVTRIEVDIAKLRHLEMYAEDHEEADSLVQYFLNRQDVAAPPQKPL